MGPSADARSKVRSCRVRCPKVSESQGSWPQHWVLVFIAPSWRDLLARPAHTRARSRAGAAGAVSPKNNGGHSDPGASNTPARRNPSTSQDSPKEMCRDSRDTEHHHPQAWWGAVSLSQREQTCQHAFIFHISHVPSSVVSPWVCVGGGVGWSGEYNVRSDSTSVL